MSSKKKKALTASVSLLFVFGIIAFIVFPPTIGLESAQGRPVILYYDFENLPFQSTQFPAIVNATLQHHFNTLMLLVYYDHKPIFNSSMIQQFLKYSEARNLTFVPSYYIESLSDRINVNGLRWVNLDMEKLTPVFQHAFYLKTSVQNVSLISVTSPYGQAEGFVAPIDIVETYSGEFVFWLMQITYLHYSAICSVAIRQVHSQAEYDSEKNYCIHYSQGVMVFDYYNLLKTGLN